MAQQKGAKTLIAEFVTYLKAKRASPLTIIAYQKECEDFFAFTKTFPLETKKVDALAYLGHLETKNLASRTIRRKFSSVSAFYKFVIYTEQTEKNPIAGLPMPKSVAKRQKVVITEEEATAMLDLPCNSWQDRMDKLCLELLYSTGGRRMDLKAKLADLNMAEASLFVIGKGNKPATLSLSVPCLAALAVYLAERPQTDCPQLLVNEDGTAYTSNQVYNGVLRSAKRAGITKHIHPHAWRRSIATHLMNRGQDLKSIQEFLRHNNLATTSMYLSADSDKVKADLKKFHPRATVAQSQ